MPIGTIIAKIVLDRPDHAHGVSEPVTGHVQLKFIPKSGGHNAPVKELLVPRLHLQLTFAGRLKTKIRKGGNGHNETFRGRVPLFSQTETLHNDRLTILEGELLEFPFGLDFPLQADPVKEQWDPHPLFKDLTLNLPPSFSDRYEGFYNNYECFCQYTVTPLLAIPGIDVETYVGVDKAAFYPVLYRQHNTTSAAEQLQSTRSFSKTVTVQNEFLMSEEHRPKGFREKAKFKLSSAQYPTYSAKMELRMPKYLIAGERCTFEVRARPDETSTAEVVPEIHMTNYSIQISGITHVRAEKHFFTEAESDSGEQGVASFMGRINEPFSKAKDWTKTITTAPLKPIHPTFTTHIIRRRYMMAVSLVITCAGETEYLKREFEVIVLPSDAAPPARETVLAGPAEPLPDYNPPPAYSEDPEEAVDIATHLRLGQAGLATRA